MNLFQKYKYRLLSIFTICLVFVGFNYYLEMFFENSPDVEIYPKFLTALPILAIYIVPVIFLLRFLIKRFNVPMNVVGLSLILGFSICSYLGGEGNSLLSLLWLSVDPTKKLITDWGPALTAPFAEEFAKGFVVLLVYLLCKKFSLKTAFVCSFISGLCFQISEDIAFIFNTTVGGETSGFAQAFERVSYALGSHTVFTILVGVGLVVLLNKDTAVSKLKAVIWMICAVVLHFFWNSPFEGKWIIPLLGAIGLNLAYYVFTVVDSLDENDRIALENNR